MIPNVYIYPVLMELSFWMVLNAFLPFLIHYYTIQK